VALLVAAVLLSWFQITNLDIGGHIAVGREIVKTRAIPQTDFLSHTVQGSPYPVHQWLGAVILFTVDHLTGTTGLILLRIAVVLLGTWLLYRNVRREGAPIVVAVGLVLLLLVAARPRFFVRPFLCTWVFLPLLMSMVEDVRQGRTRRLWPILPLMTVWGHVHSGVLFGVLFLGATVVGEGVKILFARGRRIVPEPAPFPGDVLDGWNYRRLVLFSAGAAALPYATMALVNPSGVKPLILPLLFWRSTELRQMINEYRPVDLLVDWPFVLVAAALVLGILFRPRRVDLTHLLVAGGFGLMAFQAVRGILPFAVAAAPLLGRTWGPLADDLFARVARTRHAGRANAAERLAVVAVLALAVFGSVRATQGWVYPFGFGRDPKHYPERALDFLWSQRVQGPIFNTDLWASALLWRGKGRHFPVFVDARLEAYPEEFWRDAYYRVLRAAPGWRDVLDRYDVQSAILRREPGKTDDAIGTALWEDEAWGLVYWDDAVVVYVRRGGRERNDDVLDAWEFRAFDPRRPQAVTALGADALLRAEEELVPLAEWSPGSFLPRWTLAAARTRLGYGEEAAITFAALAGRREARDNPAFIRSRAEAELVAGRRDRWASLLREVGADPADPDELFAAAALLGRAGKREEAIGLYREVLAARPGDPDALNNLALLLAVEPSGVDEATELIDRALSAAPDDPYVIASRGEIRFHRGETDSALADFRTALELLPAGDEAARETVMRWILRLE
jgi:tetratricopeptide (TPR) repeat protein